MTQKWHDHGLSWSHRITQRQQKYSRQFSYLTKMIKCWCKWSTGKTGNIPLPNISGRTEVDLKKKDFLWGFFSDTEPHVLALCWRGRSISNQSTSTPSAEAPPPPQALSEGWTERRQQPTAALHLPPAPLSLHTFVFSPSSSLSPFALNMEELICSFCRQHLFLFIFLLVFFPLSVSLFPPPLLSQAGLCCQALSEQWGCQEWWMTINLLLSSTTLLGDLQARWLPGMKTNLSFSFFPPFLHRCLPRSFHLTTSISTSPPLPKKAFIMERCVQNNIKIRVWTEGSNRSTWGLLWMCQRGMASSDWYARSLTAYLTHLHLLHCFQLFHRLEHPSVLLFKVLIIALKKGVGLIAVSK